MKLQEYMLKEDHHYYIDSVISKVVPKGTFVKPINPKWVPKHILEAHRNFRPENHIFGYCNQGIVLFKKDNIIEAY